MDKNRTGLALRAKWLAAAGLRWMERQASLVEQGNRVIDVM